MKLKIKISGPKVHDVGYRPYLTELAMRMALRGFEVYNDDEENGRQVVIALIESDEQRITKFYTSVRTERPPLADVDNMNSEEYPGEITPLWQSASINTASQMNKAIPLLLDMRDDLKAVRKTTDTTLEEIKAVRKTGDETLSEIKGMREDIQPGYANDLRQVQADIRALKDRVGMR